MIYWAGLSRDTFVREVNDAVRFSRKEDAERVLAWLVPTTILRDLCRVVKHGWATS
jgi:hypothetical protein